MIGDPRDRSAYGILFATLGLTLTLLIAGICWVATQQGADSTHTTITSCEPADNCTFLKTEVLLRQEHTLDGLWIALAALGGVLVGFLIPFPSWLRRYEGNRDGILLCYIGLALVGAIAVFVALQGSSAQVTIGALLGGLSLGLLIPSPVQGD